MYINNVLSYIYSMSNRWSSADIKYLKDNFGKTPTKDIAVVLHRTTSSIQLKANKLGLEVLKPWSSFDREFLTENYGFLSLSDIAERLSRSVYAAKRMASHLGLSKQPAPKSSPIESRRRAALTIDFVREYVAAFGYSVVSYESFDGDRKITLKCPAGHVWKTRWFDFKNNSTRCRFCVREKGNGLRKDITYIRKYFLDRGFVLLSDTYTSNRTPLVVMCPKNHEVVIPYGDFKSGSRCPRCKYEKLAESQRSDWGVIHDKLKSHGFVLASDDFIYKNNRQSIPLFCSKGHLNVKSWHSYGDSFACKECSDSGTSFAEKEVFNFIRGLLPASTVVANDRKILYGKELDVFVPEKNIGVEYNGVYWHSGCATKDYSKYLSCKERGIRYIGIFEDEWLNRRSFVEEYLRSVLGVRVPKFILRATKTTIKKVGYTDVRGLLDTYHYNGSRAAKHYYGIFYKDTLIGCFLLAKPTRQHTKADLEIVRMCLHPDYKIHGIWSYISKHVLDVFFRGQKIVSFSDNRRDTGKVYEHMGFVKDGEVPPDYFWVRGGVRYHKSSLRKTADERLSGLTETELRTAQGYSKVYDVGKTRWLKVC